MTKPLLFCRSVLTPRVLAMSAAALMSFAAPSALAQKKQELPSISVVGFGDGPKGWCSFLLDGGKVKGVSRNLPDDKIFFALNTAGTKRGLMEFWDTLGTKTMACKFTIKVSKSSAFQMKFIGANLPVAENNAANNPIAVKLNLSQQRSSGGAKKYVFATTDVAPTKVNVAELKLEGEDPGVTKCANDHNFTVTLTFETTEAEHIQHLLVMNGPSLIAKHQPCGSP